LNFLFHTIEYIYMTDYLTIEISDDDQIKYYKSEIFEDVFFHHIFNWINNKEYDSYSMDYNYGNILILSIIPDTLVPITFNKIKYSNYPYIYFKILKGEFVTLGRFTDKIYQLIRNDKVLSKIIQDLDILIETTYQKSRTQLAKELNIKHKWLHSKKSMRYDIINKTGLQMLKSCITLDPQI
jgi:hypothetical protein